MPFQTFALLDTLKHVEIAGHHQCGSLEILHLRWPAGDGLTYSTLDEALEAHGIEVAESTEAGQVSRIKIINRSAQMVFLMAGEQLIGCKQNRVMNSSIMVPPRAEMPLPDDVRRTRSLGVQQLSIFESAHLVALCPSSHDDEAGFTKLSLCRCADVRPEEGLG